MSTDPCNGPFLKCGDETIDIVTSSSSSTSFTHKIQHSHVGEWEKLQIPFLKTDRTYTASWSSDSSTQVDKVVKVFPSWEKHVCGVSNSNRRVSVSENCSIITNKILFYDPFQKILLLEENIQTFTFNAGGSEVAVFKEKWGNGVYNKVKVKGDPKVEGIQKFRLISINDNLDVVLHTCNYYFNPFPESTGQQVWGLYGDQVDKNSTNYEPGVNIILLYPQPSSLGIPLDNGDRFGGDVLHYGFYDYNATDGGFQPTKLPELDGGKDMFYPEWCRNMQSDPTWRYNADIRWNIRWNHGAPANGDYSPPEPQYTLTPNGQMISHSLKGGFYSFTICDRNGVFKTFNGVRKQGDTLYVDPATLVAFTQKLHTNYSTMGFI